MNLETFIKQYRPQLEKYIVDVLKAKQHQMPLPLYADAVGCILDCINGGKMWRGLLVMLGAQMHGKAITPDVFAAAAAMEILHTSLLIHDDFMDNDFKRRGKDSVFYHYIKQGKKLNAQNSTLYGQALGVCVGDIAFFLAAQIAAEQIEDPVVLREMIKYASREMQFVGAAQMTDVHHGAINLEPDLTTILQVYSYKTAYYSFSLPLSLGALLAGETAIEPLYVLGHDLGIIFQLKDDELGMWGETAEIGKEVGSDIRENKKTWLRHYLFMKATPAEKKKLEKLFGNTAITHEDVQYVRSVLEKYAICELIQPEIDTRVASIKKYLAEFDMQKKDTSLLTEFIDFNLNRKK
ncbi:MAG: polyprenyl synthetase family protein [Weeksellaceae bacterium]